MNPWEEKYETPTEGGESAPWEADYGDKPAPKSTSRARKGNVLQRAVMGAADLAAGAGKYGSYLLAPYDLAADAAQGRTLGTGHRERMASIEGFAEDQGARDWTSVVNQVAPEVIGTAGPMAKVESAVAQAVAKRALPKAVQKVAPKVAGITADTGTNAAYSAAQAVAEGEDPAEAAKRAALIGLGIRGGLKVVGAPFRKGANQVADKNAQFLKDQGFPVTPGMMYPDSWVAGVERTARNTPFVGGSVEGAEGRLGREYIQRYGQEAVDPLVRVVPGETRVPPRYPRPEGQPALPRATAAADEAAPPTTGREVGPSMVEPIPQPQYPAPPGGVLHVDSQGNVGKLPNRNPAFDEESGLFYSTQRARPDDATNLPATLADNNPPYRGRVGPYTPEPKPANEVGPFTRDTVEGEGRSRFTPEEPFPPRAGTPEGDTLEQTFNLEKRAPKVEGEGLDLVRNVQQHVDDAYNDVVGNTYLRADNGVSALLTASKDLDNIPWLTPQQRRQVTKVINDRMIPRLKGLGPNAILSGREVKNLDAILGEQARKFADDATTRPMSEALYTIQQRLRVATEGTTKEHRHALAMANEAHRKMLPLMRATEESLGSSGIPSALQLRRAMEHYGMKPDAINDALVQVAPNAPTSHQVNRRWIGSGLGLVGLVGGGPGAVAGMAATGLGLGAAGRMAYSPAGVKAQLALLNIPSRAKAIVESLPLQEQIKYLSNYVRQTGRALGDNQGEENAP